jgi:hypothetical protein
MRAFGKRLVYGSVGKLPYFEYRLQLARFLATQRLRGMENLEVARATRLFGRIPSSRVATIIPTYRRPVDLVRAVESVLAQTFTDQVVIVVADGDTLPPLPDDERLTAFSLGNNIGVVGVVRNIGIRASSSEFVAFLDDDNEWAPDHLERSVRAHEGGAQFTYTGLHRVTREGHTVDTLSVPFDRQRLREEGFIDASTIMVRRMDGIRFSRVPRRFGDFPREDWELAWRLSRRLSTAHIDAVTVRYVVHEGSHFTDWQAARNPENSFERRPSGDGGIG